MLIYYQESFYTQNLNMIFIVLDLRNNKHQQLRFLIFDVETKQQLVRYVKPIHKQKVIQNV